MLSPAAQVGANLRGDHLKGLIRSVTNRQTHVTLKATNATFGGVRVRTYRQVVVVRLVEAVTQGAAVAQETRGAQDLSGEVAKIA